jgi:CRP-like cAMP-binding protein
MRPSSGTTRVSRKSRAGSSRKGLAAFDPKNFLGKMGEGKAVSSYKRGQIVFSQGDAADAVFYILKGKIKLTVVSERGKEAVVGLLGPPVTFSAKAVSAATCCMSHRRERSMNA